MATREQRAYPHDLPRVSYAQNFEDILIDRLFWGQVGTFVDIGACHPVRDSNTRFFYERGWRGTNLEPGAASFRLFLEQRPEDRNLNVAASDFDGELTFYEVNDGDINGTSTLSVEIALRCCRRGFAMVEKRVPVRTIRGLVREQEIAAPDFLSIDVEAHELQVIRGIDLEHWRPKLIVVESTVPGSPEPNYQAWEPTLLEHGYRFMAFNGLNRFYLRDDLGHLARHFETPVNVFDQFVPHAWVRAEAAAAEARRELDQERARRERAEFELREGRAQLLRLRDDHHELARRRAILEHRCRHLEAQRDELGAQLDQLLDEADGPRPGPAPPRSRPDGDGARAPAATTA